NALVVQKDFAKLPPKLDAISYAIRIHQGLEMEWSVDTNLPEEVKTSPTSLATLQPILRLAVNNVLLTSSDAASAQNLRLFLPVLLLYKSEDHKVFKKPAILSALMTSIFNSMLRLRATTESELDEKLVLEQHEKLVDIAAYVQKEFPGTGASVVAGSIGKFPLNQILDAFSSSGSSEGLGFLIARGGLDEEWSPSSSAVSEAVTQNNTKALQEEIDLAHSEQLRRLLKEKVAIVEANTIQAKAQLDSVVSDGKGDLLTTADRSQAVFQALEGEIDALFASSAAARVLGIGTSALAADVHVAGQLSSQEKNALLRSLQTKMNHILMEKLTHPLTVWVRTEVAKTSCGFGSAALVEQVLSPSPNTTGGGDQSERDPRAGEGVAVEANIAKVQRFVQRAAFGQQDGSPDGSRNFFSKMNLGAQSKTAAERQQKEKAA
ncbi:unnamed protein product, partial [Amoebophrya sp. A25]